MSLITDENNGTVLEKINKLFRVDYITSQNEEKANAKNEDTDLIDEESDPAAMYEEQERRTNSLKGILPAVTQLWLSDLVQMCEVTEKLADGSRDRTSAANKLSAKWRIPMGKSGVMNFFLEIFSNFALQPNLKIHVLRLVGNSCADTDENRERVVNGVYLPFFIAQLNDVLLLPFAIPVLYNICLDYEPAQQQASTSMLTNQLVELLASSALSASIPFLSYICKLLELMAAQTSDVECAPYCTASIVFKIAAIEELGLDVDDFTSVVNAATSFLKDEKSQQKALYSSGTIEKALAVLAYSYFRFDVADEEEVKTLEQMRKNLNEVLADISALPEFGKYLQESPLPSTLRQWLSYSQPQLQVCACIMLGNVARSDAVCEELVHRDGIHRPLILIIKSSSDSSLLHAALGFLKNLALPIRNKETLGDSGLFDLLPRLWALDTLQQIQFTSISLTRQLTIGTFENVRKVCSRLSTDPDSPAASRTKLSLLIALFERTDVEPIKMEIARLITSVCRVFNSLGAGDRTPAEQEVDRVKFFSRHPDVGRPLGFMVSQTKWPVVRSEGWFVFALMARYPEGAKCIGDMLYDVKVFRPLVQLLTGKDPIEDDSPSSSPSLPSSTPASIPAVASTPDIPDALLGLSPESPEPHAQAAEMARIDRENALVLVSEMLKNRGAEMALMRRTLYEDLLKGGSELVSSYREGGPAPVIPQEGKRISAAGLNLQEIAEQSFEELS